MYMVDVDRGCRSMGYRTCSGRVHLQVIEVLVECEADTLSHAAVVLSIYRCLIDDRPHIERWR